VEHANVEVHRVIVGGTEREVEQRIGPARADFVQCYS